MFPGLNTFKCDGRLYQGDIARKAVKLSSTAIGICTDDGVVLATEQSIPSPFLVKSASENIIKLNNQIACASSGLMGDVNSLINRGRTECQNHCFLYNGNIPVESCVQTFANIAGEYCNRDDDTPGIGRPFGVAMLFSGIEDNKPQLWHLNAASSCYARFHVRAIGAADVVAKQYLMANYKPEMDINNAILLALNTIKKTKKTNKLNAQAIEVTTMTIDNDFNKLNDDELLKLIEATNWQKQVHGRPNF